MGDMYAQTDIAHGVGDGKVVYVKQGDKVSASDLDGDDDAFNALVAGGSVATTPPVQAMGSAMEDKDARIAALEAAVERARRGEPIDLEPAADAAAKASESADKAVAKAEDARAKAVAKAEDK